MYHFIKTMTNTVMVTTVRMYSMCVAHCTLRVTTKITTPAMKNSDMTKKEKDLLDMRQ